MGLLLPREFGEPVSDVEEVPGFCLRELVRPCVGERLVKEGMLPISFQNCVDWRWQRVPAIYVLNGSRPFRIFMMGGSSDLMVTTKFLLRSKRYSSIPFLSLQKCLIEKRVHFQICQCSCWEAHRSIISLPRPASILALQPCAVNISGHDLP
jgi:hypothetical protein